MSIDLATYASTVLSTHGLQSYWRLDEKSGTAAIDLMSTNSGTYQGGYTLDRLGAVKNDSAVTLDGASGEITTSIAIASPGPQGPLSLECWFKTTSASGGHLVCFTDSQTGGIVSHDRKLWIGTDGKAYWGIYPGYYQIINSTQTYNDGAWHHVVGVLASNNNMTLYVDGVNVASNTNTDAPQPYTGYWRLGNGGDGWLNAGTFFSGTIDEAAVYDIALPAATVQEHYYAADRFGQHVTLVVNDVVTCRAGDVLELWVFTDQSVPYVNLAGKGATAAAASGAILFSDSLTGISNYFSVEHVSPY